MSKVGNEAPTRAHVTDRAPFALGVEGFQPFSQLRWEIAERFLSY